MQRNNIMDLSFKELKKELKNCQNNPVREVIIRKIMKQKYIEYLNKKKIKESKIKESKINESKIKESKIKESKIKELKLSGQDKKKHIENNELDKRVGNESDGLYEDLLEEVEKIKNNETKQFINKKNKKKGFSEIDRDTMNDTLMERLNSEIYIKKNRNPYYKGVESVEKTKKEFIQPFVNNPGGIYSSLNDFDNNITNFSNK